MEYYAVFLPDKKPDSSIKSFFTDKPEALSVLKQHKNARMKAFSSIEDARSFCLKGPAETSVKCATPSVSSPIPTADKSLFVTPTSQQLVAFRKLIEANSVSEVNDMIQNPRYLVSPGDTPTIVKEGPRYNVLHIAAIAGRGEICRLILRTVADSGFIEKLHGQRTPSTDEVSAILLDLYLNMPDKCRSETPLHFAAKHGSVEVVKELMAYPQCRVAPNADGLLPREIICSRAKAHVDTPAVREAIRALLEEHYFVPLVRYEDNLVPPVIGEPFSPTQSPTLSPIHSPFRDQPLRPQGEVKAYAGPMDRDTAQTFYRLWKTPPRLVVVSPLARLARSEGPLQCYSSTPIRTEKRGRRLFANLSFEHLPRSPSERGVRQGSMQGSKNDNNSADESEDELCGTSDDDGVSEMVDSSTSSTNSIQEDQQQDDNGNHLTTAVTSTPMRLFHQYRVKENGVDSSNNSLESSCSETEFSFLCDETRTVYDRNQLPETPAYKERSLRLSNIEKGLETLGRTLATNHRVGWSEYWGFLGKFCHLGNVHGLRLLEEFLVKRHHPTEKERAAANSPTAEGILDKEIPDGSERPFGSANDSIRMLCDELQKCSMRDASVPADITPTAGWPQSEGDVAPPHQWPREPVPESKLCSPYLCANSSLKVYAMRFVTHFMEPSPSSVLKFFPDLVRKLDTAVHYFRIDAAFREIDFCKAHALFAYHIVRLVQHRAKAEEGALRGDLFRLECVFRNCKKPTPLPEPSKRETDSVRCIEHSLLSLCSRMPELSQLADDSESQCQRLWEQQEFITACGCRPKIETGVPKRTMERMKRREERDKRLTEGGSLPKTPLVVDFSSYRVARDFSSAHEDLQFNWNDTYEEATNEWSKSEDEEEEDDDVFFTAPSSPIPTWCVGAVRSSDNNNNGQVAKQDKQDANPELCASPEGIHGQIKGGLYAIEDGAGKCRPVFIGGTAASKQDIEAWGVLESVEIDEWEFPYVYAWKQAMREHIGANGQAEAYHGTQSQKLI